MFDFNEECVLRTKMQICWLYIMLKFVIHTYCNSYQIYVLINIVVRKIHKIPATIQQLYKNSIYIFLLKHRIIKSSIKYSKTIYVATEWKLTFLSVHLTVQITGKLHEHFYIFDDLFPCISLKSDMKITFYVYLSCVSVKRHFKILRLAIKSNLKGFSHFFFFFWWNAFYIRLIPPWN